MTSPFDSSQDESLEFSGTRDVLVGKTRVKFTIHTDVVCARSAFLLAATKKEWSEKGSAIELLDESPGVFNEYLRWLYNSNATAHRVREKKFFAPAIQAYILAGGLLDPTTANAIMDSIVEQSECLQVVMPAKLLALAWEKTTESSLLRRFLVDTWAHSASRRAFDDLDESVPASLLIAVAKEACCGDVTEKMRLAADKTYYHLPDTKPVSGRKRSADAMDKGSNLLDGLEEYMKAMDPP